MKIQAAFVDRTARLGVGNPIEVEAPDNDFESVFRRLLYQYGEVVNSEKIDSRTREYILVSNLQRSDTLEPYELETTIRVVRDRAFSD